MERPSMTKREFLKSLRCGDECLIENNLSYYKREFTEGIYTYRIFVDKAMGHEFQLSDKFFARAKKINLTHQHRKMIKEKIDVWKDLL